MSCYSGLHNIEIVNFHVVRHVGLHDIRVVAQVATDLKFDGEYELSGRGLGMIDLTGNSRVSLSVRLVCQEEELSTSRSPG